MTPVSSALKTAANGQHENELILHLLKLNPNRETLDRIIWLAKQELDWDYLLETADEHRVVPTINKCLSALSDEVPGTILTKIREKSRRISDGNVALTATLMRLLTILEEEKIPTFTFKGPPLAQSAYGDFRLRQYTDLDIMVRKHDALKVKEVLLIHGCAPGWELTLAQEAAVLRHYYEYPILCNKNRVLVEVHWQFAEDFFCFGFDLEEIWQNLEPVNILARPVLTLCPEDSLLVLCAHGGKHLWKRLGWINDISQLISRLPLDWKTLQARAKRLGLLRMFWLGLLLAREVSHAELPPEILIKIQNCAPLERVAGQILGGLFDQTNEDLGTLQTTRLQLKMRERLHDRMNYSVRLMGTKLVDSLFMPMGRPR